MSSDELLTVRVSRRILWMGPDAYPLQNIARTMVRPLKFNRRVPVMSFLKVTVICVLVSVAATIAIKQIRLGAVQSAVESGYDMSGYGSVPETDPLVPYLGLINSSYHVIMVVAVIAISWSAVRLLWLLWLMSKRYFSLVVETAGTPYTAIVSRDEGEVSGLRTKIMDAIDDPGADFQQVVHNHMGDHIYQYGDKNIGKVTR